MATIEELANDVNALTNVVTVVSNLIPSLVAGNAAKDATIADLTAKLAAAGAPALTPEEQAAIDAADAQAKADLASLQSVVPST